MGFKWFRPKKGNSSNDNPDIPSSSGAKKSSPVNDPKNTDIASSSGTKKSRPVIRLKNADIPSSSGVKISIPDSGLKIREGKSKNFARRERFTGRPKRDINAPIFNFGQMEGATNNFNADNELGKGGFGEVYRGRLEYEGLDVAIKRLKSGGNQGSSNFLNEIEILSRADHPNIIKLIGFCSEGGEMLVVYEYMPLGSLDSHLKLEVRDRLDWNMRVKIAAGVARALEYMHFKMKPPTTHRDLKCANILLDEGYNPKLSDFGLALMPPPWGPARAGPRGGMGTPGYMAPGYSWVTFENDVYGFGVLLLEMFTGREALNVTDNSNNSDNSDNSEEPFAARWARNCYKGRRGNSYVQQMADSKLRGRYPKEGLHQVLFIAVKCVQENPKKRPSADELVLAFDYIERQGYEPPPQSVQVSQRPATSPRASKGLIKEGLDKNRRATK